RAADYCCHLWFGTTLNAERVTTAPRQKAVGVQSARRCSYRLRCLLGRLRKLSYVSPGTWANRRCALWAGAVPSVRLRPMVSRHTDRGTRHGSQTSLPLLPTGTTSTRSSERRLSASHIASSTRPCRRR